MYKRQEQEGPGGHVLPPEAQVLPGVEGEEDPDLLPPAVGILLPHHAVGPGGDGGAGHELHTLAGAHRPSKTAPGIDARHHRESHRLRCV